MQRIEQLDLTTLSLEQLEALYREHDAEVTRLRSDMAHIKKQADVHHLRLQIEAVGKAPQNLTQGVRFSIGGKQ